MLGVKRVRELKKGSDALVRSKNKEHVTSLREIAAGRVIMDTSEPSRRRR
jgi:DNA-directed RNA polymerase subunit omega